MKHTSWIIGCAAGLGLAACAWGFPDLVERCLCWPSGWLAAAFLNLPWQVEEGRFLLHAPGLLVEVAEACSGWRFACLLAGVLGWRLARSGGWRALGVALPAAMGITVLANAIRVVVAIQARGWVHGIGGGVLDDVVHLAVGILVFLPILLLGSVDWKAVRA